jgi:hypothetical protein
MNEGASMSKSEHDKILLSALIGALVSYLEGCYDITVRQLPAQDLDQRTQYLQERLDGYIDQRIAQAPEQAATE